MDIKKFCVGGEQLGLVDWGNINESDLYKTFEYSLSAGVDEVDTSNIYGLGISEKNIAKFLKLKKEKNFKISTKVGLNYSLSAKEGRANIFKDCSEASIMNSIEGSLKRLNQDKLFSIYIHYPDPNISVIETLKVLERLKNEKLIEKIGLCNFDGELLNEANLDVLDLIDRYQTQINIINYVENSSFYNSLFKKLRKNNVEIVSYSPLNRGMLVDNIFDKLQDIKENKNDRRSRLENFNLNHKQMILTKKIHSLCKEYDYPLNLTAILFLHDYLKIDKIILGSTKVKHLKQIYESNTEINSGFFNKLCS